MSTTSLPTSSTVLVATPPLYRSIDLSRPADLDEIACDFPELTIVAGLGGWPLVDDAEAPPKESVRQKSMHDNAARALKLV